MASTAGGVELATAYVSLTVDGSKIGPSVRRGLGSIPAQADRVGVDSGRRLGDKMSKGIVSSVARIAGPLAAIFATVGIGKFISGTVDEAREAQKVAAITDAIVKSTGGAAKVTAKQVGDLSTAISNKIGVDDEAIQASANLLLTFKNVRNEVGKNNKVFDQAVGLAQDLSKAGFGSAESAAKMLGKALNDPVKGMTALGRAGVTFSDAQKTQIKEAVKQNDLLGAQKIILAEVASQVGGVAEASATVGEKATVAWANFKEQVGTALLPVLDRLGKWFIDKGLPALSAFFTALTGGGKKLGMLGEGLGKFAKAGKFIRDVFTAITTFLDALTGKADPLGKVSDGMAKFARAGAAVRDALSPLVTAFQVFFDAVTGRGDPLKMVSEGMAKVARAGAALRAFGSYVKDELWPALAEGWQTIQPGLERAKQILAETFGGESGASLRDFGTLIVDKVIPGLATLANVWLPVAAQQFSIMAGAIKGAFGAVSAYLEIQVAVARRFFTVIIDGFTLVTTFAAQMLEALSVVPGFGWAKDAADKLRDMAEKANAAKDAINGIPTKRNVTIAVDVKYSASGNTRFNNDGTGYAPGRATGGPVRKGQPYIVGEKRPELFVPDSNGTIIPRVPDSAAPAGMGGFPSPSAIADAVYDAMRSAKLMVDTRDNALATARYQNTRGQL